MQPLGIFMLFSSMVLTLVYAATMKYGIIVALGLLILLIAPMFIVSGSLVIILFGKGKR